jgi:hypothetical protein
MFLPFKNSAGLLQSPDLHFYEEAAEQRHGKAKLGIAGIALSVAWSPARLSVSSLPFSRRKDHRYVRYNTKL